MTDKIKLLTSVLGEQRIKRDVDLTPELVTGLGGKAEGYYIATTSRELIKAVETCRELHINFLIIGAGSKIALSKEGVRGLAIKNRTDSMKIFGIKGKVTRFGIGIEEACVEVESGVSLQRLSKFCGEQNLTGFEILVSSLGTVGGSLYVNQTLREKVHQVKVLTEEGKNKIKDLHEVGRDDIILAVVFKLKAQMLNH